MFLSLSQRAQPVPRQLPRVLNLFEDLALVSDLESISGAEMVGVEKLLLRRAVGITTAGHGDASSSQIQSRYFPHYTCHCFRLLETSSVLY